MRASALDECSEAGFGDFILANRCLDRHSDLTWTLRRVYWRNAQLGHRAAIQAVMECARGYAGIDPMLGMLTDGKEARNAEA